VPLRFLESAFGRFVALGWALGSTGCISSQTGKTLDHVYEQTLVSDSAASEPTETLSSSERVEDSATRVPAETALSTAKVAAPSTDSPSPPNSLPTEEPPALLDRDEVVKEAVAQSPALALMAHRVRALVHAGRAEGSMPSAELNLEAWNLPLERPYSLNEADMYMVELRQRFPAAGSLDARARSMAEEAQALLAEVSSEERVVAERAAMAFADYEHAFVERRLQERQLALLGRMNQAVEARYATGGAGLGEAARIQVELSRTERALARIEGEIARARATLNAVLRRPPGAPLGEPRRAPAETVRLPVEELMKRAEANRGATLSADARLKAATARRNAAEAEAHVPEFMVGLGYWQDPTMRPGFGVNASMSLPWLWGPGRERVAQAREEEAAEKAARENVGVEAQTEIATVHAQLRALESELLVVEDRGLPAARRSFDAFAASYSTGNTTLLDWVDVTRTVLDLEMEAAELHGDLARNIASLERAVGTALPRTSIREAIRP
jgi:outer membrane protein, heavy metal efflux system